MANRCFGFYTRAVPWSPIEFISHLRGQITDGLCQRAVFASCHCAADIWPVLSDRTTVLGSEPVLPVLVCCKVDATEPLLDVDVVQWLSRLDWTSHLLGLPMDGVAVVVPGINMSWRWVLV
jgi:hypothetical protein